MKVDPSELSQSRTVVHEPRTAASCPDADDGCTSLGLVSSTAAYGRE